MAPFSQAPHAPPCAAPLVAVGGFGRVGGSVSFRRAVPHHPHVGIKGGKGGEHLVMGSSAGFSILGGAAPGPVIGQRQPCQPRPLCYCGLSALALAVCKEGPNMNRIFFRCSIPSSCPSHCSFFQWADEDSAAGFDAWGPCARGGFGGAGAGAAFGL